MRWKPAIGGVDWLHAGFSERAGGVSTAYGNGALNLGWTREDAPERVAENRRRWVAEVWDDRTAGSVAAARAQGPSPELVTLSQVHSTDSLVVWRDDPTRVDTAGRTTLRGDGLMTAEPNVLLGIQTADCVPVLVVDVRLRAVAAFHAGWRGTVGRIVEHGVMQMGEVFGSRPEDLWAAVGPAIAACCYRVGEEVHERFRAEFRDAEELFARPSGPPQWQRSLAGDRGADAAPKGRPGQDAGWFLDLHESNRRQLLTAGLSASQIELLRECTACSRTAEGQRRYFSYRAEQGRTGRMMALIGLRSAI